MRVVVQYEFEVSEEDIASKTYMDIDRDGLCGICSTEELAQKEAEQNLGIKS